MANTYYDSQLTAAEIEAVLEAISGILTPANNGKVLAISSGKLEARSVQWGGGAPVIEALSVTANGTYTAPSGVDGYSPITVNVSGGGGGGVIVTPAFQKLSYCYVNAYGTSLYQDVSKTQFLNIYEVTALHKYALFPGEFISTRRRAGFFSGKKLSDIEAYLETPASTAQMILSDGVWLAPYAQGSDDTNGALLGRIIYKPPADGLLLLGTSNNGGIAPSYCIDMGISSSPYFAREDSIVTDVDVIYSANNGSRTPMMKTGAGEVAACLCFNASSSDYGGNWFYVLAFAETQEPLAMNSPGGMNPLPIGTIIYGNKTYYYRISTGTNGTWGGSTEYTNPLGLPEVRDMKLITSPNAGNVDGAVLAQIASILDLDPA